MMTISMVKGVGGEDIIGYIAWWTLRKGEYDVDELKASAQTVSLPDHINDRIKGRSIESAWTAATQLGSSGKPIKSPEGRINRLLSRDVGDDPAIRTRAIVMESTEDSAYRIAQKVAGKTAALIELDQSRFKVKWAAWAKTGHPEITGIVSDMRVKMGKIEGKMNDGRIRTAVLSWLQSKHRICVRGTGGVYFIPAPKGKVARKQLEGDLLAIRAWLDTISSPFSIVAMNEAGCLSIEDFVNDAIVEVKDELGEIAVKFDKWKKSEKMNAGSRMFSSGTQKKRLLNVYDKIDALKQSLGEEIGVLDNMYMILFNRIDRMHVESSKEVKVAKESKRSSKPKKTKAGTKKSGTARRRSKKTKVG
jgi:hypothetical protein